MVGIGRQALFLFSALLFVCGSANAVKPSTSASLSNSLSKAQMSRALAVEAKDLLASKPNVKVLNAENFDSVVADDTKFTVVLFHAPWSARSNKFMIEFLGAVDDFADNNELVFAVLDTPANAEIGRREHIQSFPTVKMITRGAVGSANVYPPLHFHREELVKFVKHVLLHEKFKHMEKKRKADEEASRLYHPAQGTVVELNATGFEAYTKSFEFFTFVAFYAPWCGACKDLMPELEAVAEYFKTDAKVIIAKVNSDDHPALIKRYSIAALPTMYLFPKPRLSKHGLLYTGERERYDIRASIDTNNRMADHPDMPYIDENTDMDLLMEQMKSEGRDPESLMKRLMPEGKEKAQGNRKRY